MSEARPDKKSPPRVLAKVLELILANEICVGVLLLYKRIAILEKATWPMPTVLHHQTALRLADEMLQGTSLRSLLCDEDIRGKREQQRFKTALLRCNARLASRSKIKIGFWPSEKSGLIQCADVVAYVAARSLRESALTMKLQTLWLRVQQMPTTRCHVVTQWMG